MSSLGMQKKKKVMVVVDSCKYLVFYGQDATVAWLRSRAEERHFKDTVRELSLPADSCQSASLQGRRPRIRRLTLEGASLDDEFLIVDLTSDSTEETTFLAVLGGYEAVPLAQAYCEACDAVQKVH
jgi:hypothetical protein